MEEVVGGEGEVEREVGKENKRRGINEEMLAVMIELMIIPRIRMFP